MSKDQINLPIINPVFKDYKTVEKWYTPEEFEYFKDLAIEIGFLEVASGPMVRSSYRADRIAHLV